MKNPLFLLGAGFNKDAKQVAGEYKIEYKYPLLDDLVKICFKKESLDNGKSIEECFATALQEKNYEPVRLLCDYIMRADDYLLPKLLPYGDNPENCYTRFFKRYKESSFLTFNYDSLSELFLLHMGHWYPHDGYGVPVEVDISPGVNVNLHDCRSKCLVLHLHGSLYIYINELYLTTMINTNTKRIKELSFRDKPEYIFNPEDIVRLFHPYITSFRITGPEPIESRVIAPVPNKAEGLRGKFISDVYSRAYQLISDTDTLFIIGYDFNPNDKISYHRLLEKHATSEKAQAILIKPEAGNIEKRLKTDYPQINWQSIPRTFKSWVDAGFSETS
jgi:hypothetical protein